MSAVQVAFGKRRASRVTKAAGRAISPRPASKPARCCRNSASSAEQARRAQGRRQLRRRHVQGRPEGGRAAARRIGKGFAGVIKRHHFSSNRATPRQLASRTTSPARSAWRRTRAACSPASAWPGHLGDVTPHRAEPRDRAHRRRAPAAHDQGLGAGLQGRRRDRAPSVKAKARQGAKGAK